MEQADLTPYGDHWEHVRDELALLDRMLRELVERARRRRRTPGLLVADEEIDGLLPAAGPTAGDLRSDVEARLQRSRLAGVDLPLDRLGRTFGLTAWELEVVVLCLAAMLHGRYERVYAYLQDDVTRRHPGVDLALDLLGDDVAARAAGRVALADGMPLRRGGLVEVTSDCGSGESALRLDERVAAQLLLSPSPLLRDWVRLVAPAPGAEDPAASRLAAAVGAHLTGGRSERLTIALHGAAVHAMALAEAVCAELRSTLLVVDLRLLLASGAAFQPALREAMREAVLQPAAVLVTGADSLGEQRGEADLRLRQLRDALEEFGWLGFVCSPRPLGPPELTDRWLGVDVPEPDPVRLAACWRAALAGAGMEAGADEARSLASRYRLSAREITSAVETAALLDQLDARPAPRPATVERVCRERAGTALGPQATRVVPRCTWSDIVLPREQERQLREVAAAARSRHRVLTDWGLGAKLSRGRGLSALFSGPPGTGKTLAAEIIAGEMGLDLYVIDLAAIVSKYIGETEKNLSLVFDAAEATSLVLFFDEADALFGKRSEVRDAHDRYANIEIGYLLQRLETYSGLVVLATNLKGNLDDAFLRRLTFFVDFPFPGLDERRRIWRAVLPEGVPLAGDLDWEALARPFAVAGGSIRGAALHAAYQAAAAGEPVGMPHLLLGLRRELDKLGRAPNPADFGRHWEVVAPR